jgi:hypothetical protein
MTPFSPLPAFAWSLQHMRRILQTPGIEPVIIHPAIDERTHQWAADGACAAKNENTHRFPLKRPRRGSYGT